jgi:hypothetical protein
VIIDGSLAMPPMLLAVPARLSSNPGFLFTHFAVSGLRLALNGNSLSSPVLRFNAQTREQAPRRGPHWVFPAAGLRQIPGWVLANPRCKQARSIGPEVRPLCDI